MGKSKSFAMNSRMLDNHKENTGGKLWKKGPKNFVGNKKVAGKEGCLKEGNPARSEKKTQRSQESGGIICRQARKARPGEHSGSENSEEMAGCAL